MTEVVWSEVSRRGKRRRRRKRKKRRRRMDTRGERVGPVLAVKWK